MTDDLGGALIQKFGEDVVADVLKPSVFTAAPSRYEEVAGWLLTEGNFRFLSDLTVNHTPGRQVEFEVVCRLTDIDSPRRVTLRTPAPGDPPTVASLTALWPGADWFEREAFDMFGVIFDGHPNLTRILMPDEWEGHPLRKDYAVGKVPVEYKHLSPGF